MMFGGGKGMRGGAGTANMLGAARRAAVTTFQEPLPSSTSSSQRHNSKNNSNGLLSISSGSGSSSFASRNSGMPISANSGLPSNWPTSAASPASFATPCFDEFEWVFVDGNEEDKHPHGALNDFVLGPVPSVDEVQNAVSSLRRVFGVSSCPQPMRDKFSYNAGKEIAYPSPTGPMHRVRSAGSELDWVEPSLHLYNTPALRPYVTNSVYNAFDLLQTEPTVQKMVFSLSSDETVWDAVLKNEVVRELRELYYEAEDSNPLSFGESSDENFVESSKTTNFVIWIFDNTKAKVMDLFEKITKLVNELFKLPTDNETKTAGTPDPFEERLRISFLLSVLVLLVVVVTRAQTT